MDSIPSLQNFNSQVSNSCPSLSCPSEPPDVGNWFSSYKYQSPDPDSNFGFEESAFGGRESQKGEEEEANLEKVKIRYEVVEDDKHNEEVCLTKSLDSFNSQSLLSEPPDIRNWFSSYVYESFASDTCSLIKDVVSEENECEEERFDLEVINEDEDRSENVHPKGCVQHNSSSDENKRVKEPSSRGDGSVETKRSLASSSTSHLEKILQRCMQDKTLEHNFGPNGYGETTRLNHGSPGCSREAQTMSLDAKKGSDYTTPEMVQNNDIREAKSKPKIQHDMVDMSTSLAKIFSARSSTCARNKENDGFLSARKDRCTKANDENSWKKPEMVALQCSTNTGRVSLACEKHVVTKRKALTEATNVQQSNATEITGKWRCPQTGKPNVGPALKQLRLEKWVHRI